ncbi:class I SAM-dependent methyltransferase [Maribacter sp. 2308TA10-17]|uniref:class I SAM-dependent methyltransferase n=1 Tax=Maribacter sp. 2308TA10-17 TaxID=3386276 RepID=UPI0039BD7BB6
MAKEYDDITAFHYASYRPPLHSKILTRLLGNESYGSGLDIGCGTGQSSIALADFCDRVVGIDPSGDMISKGIKNSKVVYSFFDKTQISFNDASFDIITLAGSLWYAKSQQLLDEIVRVGGKHSKVLIYDFQVLLDDIFGKLGFEKKGDSSPEYNHQENFSGLDTSEIKKLNGGCESMLVQMTAKELAHLVLSVKKQYSFLANLYGSQKLYDTIVTKIDPDLHSRSFDIEADTFFTLYQIK